MLQSPHDKFELDKITCYRVATFLLLMCCVIFARFDLVTHISTLCLKKTSHL